MSVTAYGLKIRGHLVFWYASEQHLCKLWACYNSGRDKNLKGKGRGLKQHGNRGCMYYGLDNTDYGFLAMQLET